MGVSDFELFCERNQVGMYRVAMQILNDSQLAEDAVQDTFMRIFRIIGRLEFEAERAEKLYALRAVKSAAIDILRREKPAENIEDIDCLTSAEGDSTYYAVSGMETASTISQLLGPTAGAIISYRNIGLSDMEISATLGISISNVRTTVYRAKQRVSDALQKGDLMLT